MFVLSFNYNTNKKYEHTLRVNRKRFMAKCTLRLKFKRELRGNAMYTEDIPVRRVPYAGVREGRSPVASQRPLAVEGSLSAVPQSRFRLFAAGLDSSALSGLKCP